jgi:hypothetical protein
MNSQDLLVDMEPEMENPGPDIMKYARNPLTGDYLCWIPNTDQAYYVVKKSGAKSFCNKINIAFKQGKLKIIDGKVVKV